MILTHHAQLSKLLNYIQYDKSKTFVFSILLVTWTYVASASYHAEFLTQTGFAATSVTISTS